MFKKYFVNLNGYDSFLAAPAIAPAAFAIKINFCITSMKGKLIMKHLILLATSLLTVFGSLSAQAATGTGTFPIVINFTSTCSVNTATLAPVFNYTSGQASAAVIAGVTNFTVTCSNMTPYALSLDAAGGSGATAFTGTFTAPTGSYTDTTSVLSYTLTLPTTTAGTGAAQTYALGGGMVALQTTSAGTSYPYTITNNHTMTVTY